MYSIVHYIHMHYYQYVHAPLRAAAEIMICG